MYRYKLSKTVMKFLEKRDKAFLLRFEEKLTEIRKDPYNPLADVEPYKWYDGDYRLRIGKYRFLYTVKEEEIVVYFYDADSRGGIYK
jgi:mRNA interferase RelE/StbE